MSNLFRLQFNGLTIEENTDYGIVELEGTNGLPIRISSDLKTGDNGGYVWKNLYGMRTISFSGWISSADTTTYFDRKRALINAFSVSTSAITLTLRLWDGTEKSLDCYVLNQPMIVEKAGYNNFCEFKAQLIAADPFFSDTAVTTQIFLPVVGGFPIPFTIPFSLAYSSGGLGSIVNGGTQSAYARYDLVGPLTSPTVTNTTTGESFTINTTILSGETVSVYRNQQGLFVLKGTTNYMQYFTGTFFKLVVGTNTLGLTATNSDVNAYCLVTFQNKTIV